MVSLQSADNALKSVYLGVVANQLNINANPLLSQIKRTTKDVWGKEIVKLAPYGINGGIGAGTETGSLPIASGNNYVQFKATLKNLYGSIEISDKAIRASKNDAGAFVNLLNDEMESLVKASAFNLGRMIYGDGTGKLGTIASVSANVFTMDSVNNFIEGMLVDIYNGDVLVKGGVPVKYVDRANKQITVELPDVTASADMVLYIQGSKDNEITGLGAIFSDSTDLYGLTRSAYPWLKPFTNDAEGEISDFLIQTAIDAVEDNADSKINYIACSKAIRRAYQTYLGYYRKNVEVVDINGTKTIAHNGIPVVGDRFVKEGEIYLLNTNDFVMHELCDWKWLEGESGNILKQIAGKPAYTATLVKYAELICDKPNGQAKISNVSSSVTYPNA